MLPRIYTSISKTRELFNYSDMRKINEKDYKDFTIVGKGWSVTLSKFKDAVYQFSQMPGGVLYGNKKEGGRAILDSK